MLSTQYDFLTSARNRRFRPEERQLGASSAPVSTRRRVLSSKFFISLIVTLIIIVAQIFLFHYYIELDRSNSVNGNNLEKLLDGDEWKCILSKVHPVQELASRYEVDLVIIDPDLLNLFDHSGKNRTNLPIVFSGTDGKVNQESNRKTIFHLAAINETSGGQPNLKLFYNALNNNGYTVLKYVENNKRMQPEVYRRASHLFDDMPQDGVVGHKYSHDSNDLHDLGEDNYNNELNNSVYDQEVSKIYTEFLSHLFILNQTKPGVGELKASCSYSNPNHFTVIHVLIMYNFEHDQKNYWYQPSLIMNEIDKHKLLRYNVHSFDFKIPIEHPYVHQKRKITDILLSSHRKKKKVEKLRVLGPEGDRALVYANNTYTECEKSKFNITGLNENRKFISNYLINLDQAKILTVNNIRNIIQEQLVIAFEFMKTFSNAYGNFSYWLTGSSLLSYHKNCDLILALYENIRDDMIVNVEFGLFASEVNGSVLEDLANAQNIGIIMLSDWRRPNALVNFQLKDCPNLILYLYFYQLKRDFYQDYFITDNTMTTSHKLAKRARLNTSHKFSGHHVFNTNNLDLCWTKIDNLPLFRVPCNVHDHLRRIYVI